MLILGSKEAEWDKDLNSYVLNYHGRASQVDHEYDGRGASYFGSLSRLLKSSNIRHLLFLKEKISIWDMAYTLQLISVLK